MKAFKLIGDIALFLFALLSGFLIFCEMDNYSQSRYSDKPYDPGDV